MCPCMLRTLVASKFKFELEVLLTGTDNIPCRPISNLMEIHREAL